MGGATMTRQEAEQLIGERVFAWTAANGEYVGTLVEVKGRPWRGVVFVTGVVSPATPWEAGRFSQRRGFRPGDRIEVGGVNIKLTTERGRTYLDCLRTVLTNYEEWARDLNPKDGWWLPRVIESVRDQIAREEQTEVVE
jgi:hypothetical protein